MGPLVMALWVQAGLRFVQSNTLARASTTMYVDDRTITGRRYDQGFQQEPWRSL